MYEIPDPNDWRSFALAPSNHVSRTPHSREAEVGRTLLRGQVNKHFQEFEKERIEADSAAWYQMTSDERWGAFDAHWKERRRIAEERGHGGFGRE